MFNNFDYNIVETARTKTLKHIYECITISLAPFSWESNDLLRIHYLTIRYWCMSNKKHVTPTI